MPNPSVRKELLKRAQQANATSKAASQAYDAARKKYALEWGAYNSVRLKYETAMKTFGPAKFNQIAEHKLAPAGDDMAQIAAILKLGNQVMVVGNEFGVEIDTITRLFNAFQAAVAKEKLGWDALHKYLADKDAMKEMGDAAYKKWKKELRADLF